MKRPSAFWMLGPALVTLLAASPALMADERRDIVFECPCSAEIEQRGLGSPGVLKLKGALRSHRASPTGEIRLTASPWDVQGAGVARPLFAQEVRSGEWQVSLPTSNDDDTIEIRLMEQVGSEAGEMIWSHHESIALWSVPKDSEDAPKRFVDLLTDTDGDGVGDVNERLAGTDWQDADATPGVSVVDVLALHSESLADLDEGFPQARIMHLLAVADARLQDSGSHLRLRSVGMAPDVREFDLLTGEYKGPPIDERGADISIHFGSVDENCPPPSVACAQMGAERSTLWRDATAWLGLGSALTAVHELGHVMGLAHSAYQGESHGAWAWSRGHYITRSARSEDTFGTIMTYASKRHLAFSDPRSQCPYGPCGVPAREPDGADAVKSLNLLRFQIAARRASAPDTDGDGWIDAIDDAPDNAALWHDRDGDGVGDLEDEDNDNDGVVDVRDAFPLDPDEWEDQDLDGIGDNQDDEIDDDFRPFLDVALRRAVEEALGKAEDAEIGPDELATLSELAVVPAFGMTRAPVRNLTGLEHAEALRSLDLIRQSVADLSPLQDLRELHALNLSFAPLRGLEGLPRASPLQRLVLEGSNVREDDLPALADFCEIETLSLADLELQDLSWLEGYCASIVILDLRKNWIGDIAPIAGQTSLEALQLTDNRLVDISPLTQLESLEELQIGGNNITDLSALSGLTGLRSLFLEFNHIRDLAPLSDLDRLASLSVGANRIADLRPLSGLRNLTSLSLPDNEINDVSPLSSLAELRALNLAGNRISDIEPLVRRDLFDLEATSPPILILFGNPLDHASIEAHMPTLRAWGVEVLYFPQDEPESATIKDASLRAQIVESAIGSVWTHTQDTPLDRLGLAEIGVLRIFASGVYDLAGIEHLTGLQALHAASNRIDDLTPLKGLASLRHLDLRDNRIADLSPLIENAELGAGDRLLLGGNPLSNQSLNQHVPELLRRGVSVSLDPVIRALVSDGDPVYTEISGYFEARLQGISEMKVSVDEDARVEAEVANRVLVLRPMGAHGSALVTVRASNASGDVESLRFEVRLKRPWRVPLASLSTGNSQRFVRLVNQSNAPGEVEMRVLSERGKAVRSAKGILQARQTRHLGVQDFRMGASAPVFDGLPTQNGAELRAEVRSRLDLQVQSFASDAAALVASVHDEVARSGDAYLVPVFLAARHRQHESHLQLVNYGEMSAEVFIHATDDTGASGESAVRLTLAPGAGVRLSASDLESGSPRFEGAFGEPEGHWRLRVVSEADLGVMSVAASRAGHFTNLSTGASANLKMGGDYWLPLVPSLGDLQGRRGVVRIGNRAASEVEVAIRVLNDEGRAEGTLNLVIDAGETVNLTSEDIAFGNPDKGLTGASSSSSRHWHLKLTSEQALEAGAYVVSPDGLWSSAHDVVEGIGRSYEVAYFARTSGNAQQGMLRVVNPNSQTARVAIAGLDHLGASVGEALMVSIPPHGARFVSARDFVAAGWGMGAEGRFSAAQGAWRLRVDSEVPILVMSLLDHPSGHLRNVSTSR